MRTIFKIILLLLIMSIPALSKAQHKIGLVVHGGAGNIKEEQLSPEEESAYRLKLQEALNAGWDVLNSGKSSIEAVTAAIKVLEDSPLFNAGKGSVLTKEGKHELDASIMDGSSGLAGAVAAVSTIKNPILAAKAIMERSPHVLLSGEGAERFAAEQGLETVDPSYFLDRRRYEQLQKIQQLERERKEQEGSLLESQEQQEQKFGTVGAVAIDKEGKLAAGTSTGGMTNKDFGRIGDSPIIGAGTYADNNTCAVSATGHGEFFIRNVVAYDISALMKYQDKSLNAASKEVIDKLQEKGGEGGVIAIDRMGNIAMPFNTTAMFRGFIEENGKPKVFIFK